MKNTRNTGKRYFLRGFLNTARKNVSGFVSVISLIFFLSDSQLAFSMEPSVTILGDVVGKGATEMKTAFNKWISISDKAYPVMDGSHLRSGDGMMSSIFRDGARMEVGKNSEIIVTGTRGNYAVDLSKGKIAFSLPLGISFSVTTATATIQTQVRPNMIRTVSTTSQDYVRGSVGYDGRGTSITAVSGTLLVKDARGVAAYTVAAGNSIYIAGTESGHRAAPAQLAQPVTASPKAVPPSAVIGSQGIPLLPLVLIEGGAFLAVKSESKERGVTSPHIP